MATVSIIRYNAGVASGLPSSKRLRSNTAATSASVRLQRGAHGDRGVSTPSTRLNENTQPSPAECLWQNNGVDSEISDSGYTLIFKIDEQMRHYPQRFEKQPVIL